ncbi:ParB/RepB/Spo0J family partition protein [Bradyrhizobium sp.]|uniref:ParB/RepB/Spo0J family partition protein n=1 Tax=Bradyrhizobium sp. TaxID=376 RepID=UPI0007C956E5|nr:ParB/RepB/Spo0J family partition protein [Bradyrhizobium sp.]
MAKRKETVRRRAVTRAGIKRPTDTGETVDKIAAKLAASAGAMPKHAKAGAVVELALKDIRVAGKVFQWKNPGMVPSDDHIFDLAKATQNTGVLDPILVLPVADKYYVIDGHHRLAAYITAEWKGGIRAIVFNGSLDEAVREALRTNNKNKLSMTTADRTAAAWRLVKLGKPGAWPDSISEIAEMCVIGETTVDRMRAIWTTLHNGQYEGIEDLSWKQARDTAAGKDRQAFDEESWLEERARNLADDIRRYKLALSRNPEITALALEMLDPGLPAELMAHWEPRRPFDPTQMAEEELDEEGQPRPF